MYVKMANVRSLLGINPHQKLIWGLCISSFDLSLVQCFALTGPLGISNSL